MHHVGGPNPQPIKAIHNYFDTTQNLPPTSSISATYPPATARGCPHTPRDQSAWPQLVRPHFHRGSAHVPRVPRGWTQPTPEAMAQLKPPLFRHNKFEVLWFLLLTRIPHQKFKGSRSFQTNKKLKQIITVLKFILKMYGFQLKHYSYLLSHSINSSGSDSSSSMSLSHNAFRGCSGNCLSSGGLNSTRSCSSASCKTFVALGIFLPLVNFVK